MRIILLVVFLGISLIAKHTELLNEVKNDVLLSEHVSIVSIESVNYLVAVSNSKIEDKTPEAKMKAIKEARMLSQKALMNYIYGTEVSTDETLEKKTVSLKVIENGKVVSSKKFKSKKYLKIIKEKGTGLIKNVFNVGKWKSKDKTRYFSASAIKIPSH